MVKKIPNILTSLRILLALFLILSFALSLWFLKSKSLFNAWICFATSFAIFVCASLTDFFDGMIARKTKSITTFGEIFDPLADKLIINTYLIGLMGLEVIPFWVVTLFIFRDLIVNGFRLLYAQKNVKTYANFLGKSKTLLQIFGIILTSICVLIFSEHFQNLEVFLNSWTLEISNSLLWFALLVSWVSGVLYLYKWRVQALQK